LPDVAGGGGGSGGGGGGGGSNSGVQSTSQDIPTLDLLWVESKSKKAALKVRHVYVLFSNHMKYKYFVVCSLWLSDWVVVYLDQGGQLTVGFVPGLDECTLE